MEISTLNIVSRNESYEIDEHNVYGELFLSFEDFFFPCEKWGDLVLSITDMWLVNGFALLNESIGNDETFFFMDGPYQFNAIKRDSAHLQLSFYDNYNLIRNNIIVKLVSFMENIIKISRTVLSFLYDNSEKCSSELMSTVKRLESRYEALKKGLEGYSL